jgi:hypothetical protein
MLGRNEEEQCRDGQTDESETLLEPWVHRFGAKGLESRHAKLAVGAASTIAVFLAETQMKNRPLLLPFLRRCR